MPVFTIDESDTVGVVHVGKIKGKYKYSGKTVYYPAYLDRVSPISAIKKRSYKTKS
jgi:hypothetical protein